MHTHVHRGVGLGLYGLAPCAALLTLALAGCAADRPDPLAESSASRAVGLAEPITFRTEAGPLDEPAAGNALSFSDTVQRAVTTDPRLQAALARVRIAMAEADQTRLLPNPVLNFVLRWGPGKPQIEVSLAQDLIQTLRIPRQSRAADHRLRQVAADAVTVALDVTSEVQERYTAAQASATLVPLLEERLSLIEKLVATAKSRLDAGEGTRADVATLNAQRVELLVEIDGVRITEREERLRLARLIGEPSAAATWTLDAWASPSIGDQPEASWVDAGLQHRPEIQAIAWRLKALGDDEALVGLLPWEGASVGVDATRDDDWFVGPLVSTPIPVFDTGKARRARVTAEQIEARHDLTLAKRKIVEEVRVAFQTLAASKSNLSRIQIELIPLQQQRRQLAEDAYRAGQTDVTPLFLAEQDLRVAQAQLIEVERQAANALVRLERAVGGPGVAASMANSTTPPIPSPEATDADGQPISSAHRIP